MLTRKTTLYLCVFVLRNYSEFIRAFPDTAVGAGVATNLLLKLNANYLIRPINRTAMNADAKNNFVPLRLCVKKLFGIHSCIRGNIIFAKA